MSHSFPVFYACYLLKSARTSRTYKNYIGSSPDPVRRLRQHNGVIHGGARETAGNRPWIMHLLVHGFPSRSAAMSFEYAWQNNHKSRFLRDRAGYPLFHKRAIRIEDNISVLQHLIKTHPFSTWPLHVKLFTEEAVQYWNKRTFTSSLFHAYRHHFRYRNFDGNNLAVGDRGRKEKEHQNQQQILQPLFPPGFTCSVELEGVDGSSGLRGSGRKGPVCITDKFFTSPHLAKNKALIAAGQILHCSVCTAPIHEFPTNHLNIALCTHRGCPSVAHLACLAILWLKTERNLVNSPSVQSALSTLFSSPSSSMTSSSPFLQSTPTCSTFPLHVSKNQLPTSGSVPSSPVSLSSLSLSLSSAQSPLSSGWSPTSSATSTSTRNTIAVSCTSSMADKSLVTRSTIGGRLSKGKGIDILKNPFELGKGMIPRGGSCPSCRKYMLWGDIIRGCYRRHAGRVDGSARIVGDENGQAIEEETEGMKEQEQLEKVSGVRKKKIGLGEDGAKMKKTEMKTKKAGLKVEAKTQKRRTKAKREKEKSRENEAKD